MTKKEVKKNSIEWIFGTVKKRVFGSDEEMEWNEKWLVWKSLLWSIEWSAELFLKMISK